MTDGLRVTIPNLEPGEYSVSVAGRKKQGLGPYSEKMQVVIRAPTPTGILQAHTWINDNNAVLSVLVEH